MNKRPIRTAALRYQRSYRFTVEALQTLCCTSGGMRERLQKIDLEFFALNSSELPSSEKIRSEFNKIQNLVTSKEGRHPHEGRIAATLDQLHHTKLKALAQLIWQFHEEFLDFMQHDEPTAS